jgi:hypothetical protein
MSFISSLVRSCMNSSVTIPPNSFSKSVSVMDFSRVISLLSLTSCCSSSRHAHSASICISHAKWFRANAHMPLFSIRRSIVSTNCNHALSICRSSVFSVVFFCSLLVILDLLCLRISKSVSP